MTKKSKHSFLDVEQHSKSATGSFTVASGYSTKKTRLSKGGRR